MKAVLQLAFVVFYVTSAFAATEIRTIESIEKFDTQIPRKMSERLIVRVRRVLTLFRKHSRVSGTGIVCGLISNRQTPESHDGHSARVDDKA